MDKDCKIYLAGNHDMIGTAIWESLKVGGYINLVGFTENSPDLLDTIAVKNFFEKEKPEYVILTSANIGEYHSDESSPADIIYKNLQIQNNIIGECFRNKVKKLLILGNMSVYPEGIQGPIREDQLLTSPLSYKNEPYAITKIAAIKMCESFNLQYSTNYLVATPAQIYGPNDHLNLTESHIIPELIRKMHLAKCVFENNWSSLQKDIKRRSLSNVSGSSTLDELIYTLNRYGIYSHHLELSGFTKSIIEFLWSGDFADACIFMLNNVDFTDSSNFNIGTGMGGVNIKNLAKLVAEIVGYNGRLKFIPLKAEERTDRLIDVSKINALGWKYSTELEEGVFLFYQWYLKDLEQINE